MLLNAAADWRYHVNLAGSELPRFNVAETERSISAFEGRRFFSVRNMPEEDMGRLRCMFKLAYRLISSSTSHDIVARS